MIAKITLLIFSGGYYVGNAGSMARMGPAEFIFWFILTVLIIFSILGYLYLQRYEIMLTRLHRYMFELTEEQRGILGTFKFYHVYSATDRQRFEKRVRNFLVAKDFKAIQHERITEEMKVLIAAACIHLTFGHRPFYLSHFNTIYISPSSPLNLKGIKQQKTLTISWLDFFEGYSNVKDGYNPGMASLAMALILEEKLRNESDKLFGNYAFRNWHTKSKSVAALFIQTGLTPFKNYTEIDKDEYFATSVVYFFESPENFHAKFPDLYDAMKKLLNQNPLTYKNKA